MLKYFIAVLLSLSCNAQTYYEAIVKKDGNTKASQYVDAIRVNIRSELRSQLAPIVSAIRYSENGRRGMEYGIMHKRCPDTYRGQAGWCAATVQKNYDRWVRLGKNGNFINFLGRAYCPVGAKNDPEGLNRHWVKNVKYFTSKFMARSLYYL